MSTTKEQRVAALRDAIEKGGGILKFAKVMGVSHQAVYKWLARGWAPLDRAVTIEAIFGVPSDAVMDPAVRSALAKRDAAAAVL